MMSGEQFFWGLVKSVSDVLTDFVKSVSFLGTIFNLTAPFPHVSPSLTFPVKPLHDKQHTARAALLSGLCHSFRGNMRSGKTAGGEGMVLSGPDSMTQAAVSGLQAQERQQGWIPACTRRYRRGASRKHQARRSKFKKGRWAMFLTTITHVHF